VGGEPLLVLVALWLEESRSRASEKKKRYDRGWLRFREIEVEGLNAGLPLDLLKGEKEVNRTNVSY
jgi:hypothetical protein